MIHVYDCIYIYINAHDNTLTYVVYIQHAAQNYISLYWTLSEKCRCLYNHATYVWIGSTIKTGGQKPFSKRQRLPVNFPYRGSPKKLM